jgi:hypothetical protein
VRTVMRGATPQESQIPVYPGARLELFPPSVAKNSTERFARLDDKFDAGVQITDDQQLLLKIVPGKPDVMAALGLDPKRHGLGDALGLHVLRVVVPGPANVTWTGFYQFFSPVNLPSIKLAPVSATEYRESFETLLRGQPFDLQGLFLQPNTPIGSFAGKTATIQLGTRKIELIRVGDGPTLNWSEKADDATAFAVSLTVQAAVLPKQAAALVVTVMNPPKDLGTTCEIVKFELVRELAVPGLPEKYRQELVRVGGTP